MSEELSFHQKLVAIQSSLVASKDKENKFGGFSYRTAEGILKAVKPHLAKHELFMSITDDIILVGGENEVSSTSESVKTTKEGAITTTKAHNKTVDARYYLRSTVTITDGDKTVSAHAMARESLSKKGMDDAQVTGASSSYARKYALNGMFGIDDSKQDPDTNHGSDAMNNKIDEILASCNTREEAVEKLGKIRESKLGTPAVMKYAAMKFKEKYPS